MQNMCFRKLKNIVTKEKLMSTKNVKETLSLHTVKSRSNGFQGTNKFHRLLAELCQTKPDTQSRVGGQGQYMS